MAEIKPVGVPFDRTFRSTINGNFAALGSAVTDAEQAKVVAESAKADAEQAKTTAESVQTQFDEVTGASTIDPAVEQMKVGSDGVTVYPSPDARVRTGHNDVVAQLADKTNKTDSVVPQIPENSLSSSKLKQATDNDKIKLANLSQEVRAAIS